MRPKLISNRDKLFFREENSRRNDKCDKRLHKRCNKVKSLSRVRLFVTPWTVAHQALVSLEFSRQEYSVGCHALFQGIFPTQGLNPDLLHCRVRLFTVWATRESQEMPWIIPILCNFKLFFNVDHFLKLLNDLLQYLFCLCVCVCLVSFFFWGGGWPSHVGLP